MPQSLNDTHINDQWIPKQVISFLFDPYNDKIKINLVTNIEKTKQNNNVRL